MNTLYFPAPVELLTYSKDHTSDHCACSLEDEPHQRRLLPAGDQKPKHINIFICMF